MLARLRLADPQLRVLAASDAYSRSAAPRDHPRLRPEQMPRAAHHRVFVADDLVMVDSCGVVVRAERELSPSASLDFSKGPLRSRVRRGAAARRRETVIWFRCWPVGGRASARP
ncbi:MAG: hypothetical protein AB7P69_29655, partial [Candidatus Binatia bacterium]